MRNLIEKQLHKLAIFNRRLKQYEFRDSFIGRLFACFFVAFISLYCSFVAYEVGQYALTEEHNKEIEQLKVEHQKAFRQLDNSNINRNDLYVILSRAECFIMHYRPKSDRCKNKPISDITREGMKDLLKIYYDSRGEPWFSKAKEDLEAFDALMKTWRLEDDVEQKG